MFPECPGRSISDLVAPDGKHVARLSESYCGMAFTTSHAYQVGIRMSFADAKDEDIVFITFETAPELTWRDRNHLVIVVNGVHAINKSLHKAGGIAIIYRLQPLLTEEAIRAQLETEQRRNVDIFHDRADSINANTRERYESFLRWADENTESN